MSTPLASWFNPIQSAVWPPAQLLLQSMPSLLHGALLTVKFALLSMGFGLAAAVVIALMNLSRYRFLQRIARCYVSVMRGTPLLVQIFLVYYALPERLSLSPTAAGVLALSANVAAYLSESMRGAIHGIERDQWLASYSLGLSHLDTLRYIIAPQALRLAVPSLANSLISLVKDTSLVSVITVNELLSSAQQIIASTYQPMPLFLGVAVIYWVLCTLLETAQRWLERYLALPSCH